MDTARELVTALLSDEAISESAILAVLQRSRHIDSRDAELANEIIKEAGLYLTGQEMRSVISADFSDDDARKLIALQKERLRRYVPLLPSVLAYFKSEKPDRITSIVEHIDDCCRDVPLIATAQRRDKSERALEERYKATATSIAKSIENLKSLKWNFSTEHDDLRDAYHAFRNGRSADRFHRDGFHFEDLIQAMNFCLNSLYIVGAIFEIDKTSQYVEDNQVKKHIVDCVYLMSRAGEGPPLVTTPGSDFSALCSLIYEMATGIPDESLAGAINRFARSDERREADEEDANDVRFDNNPTPDNFYSQKKRIRADWKKIEEYKHLLTLPELPEEPRLLISDLIRHTSDRAAAAEAEYGPNIIWATQVSVEDWTKQQEESHEREERLREQQVALGKAIRKAEKLGYRHLRGR